MTFNYAKKTLSHLTVFLREYPEFKRLCEFADTLISDVWNCAEYVINARFVLYCHTDVLARYDDMLGIKNSADFSEEARRNRIIMRLIERSPINYPMLRTQLRLMCGGGGSLIYFDRADYVLNVRYSLYKDVNEAEIYDMLRRLIPAAVELSLEPRRNTHRDLSKFTHRYLSGFTYKQLTFSPQFRENNDQHIILQEEIWDILSRQRELSAA